LRVVDHRQIQIAGVLLVAMSARGEHPAASAAVSAA